MKLIDLFDAFDVLAVILGVFFNIRKLDAVRRTREEFPHVSAEDWTRWQSSERSVYGLGSWACFLKVPLKLLIALTVIPIVGYTMQIRIVAAAVDLTWLLTVILTFVRTLSLAKERRRLGILLGGWVADPSRPRTPDDDDEDDDDEEENDEDATDEAQDGAKR